MRALLDAAWYARRNGLEGPDAAWHHFCEHGLDPNPLFDRQWYRAAYPDSALADPLDHFLEAGSARALSPSPLFESEWYLQNNPDVREAGADAYSHYLGWGRYEGRLPNHWCDPAYRGNPTLDLTLPPGFIPEDLLGYIPHYTTLSRLVSGAEPTTFFAPRTPWWIFAKVAAEPEKIHLDREAVFVGGRREFFSGTNVHTPDVIATGPEGYRAFQVRYAVSPIIRNALTTLGRDLGSPGIMECVQDEIAQALANRPDVPSPEINIVADTMSAPLLQRQLATSAFAAVNIVTLDPGYLCRVKLLQEKPA